MCVYKCECFSKCEGFSNASQGLHESVSSLSTCSHTYLHTHSPLPYSENPQRCPHMAHPGKRSPHPTILCGRRLVWFMVLPERRLEKQGWETRSFKEGGDAQHPRATCAVIMIRANSREQICLSGTPGSGRNPGDACLCRWWSVLGLFSVVRTVLWKCAQRLGLLEQG